MHSNRLFDSEEKFIRWISDKDVKRLNVAGSIEPHVVCGKKVGVRFKASKSSERNPLFKPLPERFLPMLPNVIIVRAEEKALEERLCCEVCGSNRITERAHIIPTRSGGQLVPDNIMRLCPTCHELYDRDKLTVEEFMKVWYRVRDALKCRGADLDPWRKILSERYGVVFAEMLDA